MHSCVFVIQKNLHHPIPKNISLYVIKNLCPSNKKIFNYLYKLKKQNKIYKVWSFNSTVFFNKSNTEFDYGQQVEHFDEIDYFLNSTNSESDFVP